MQNNQTIARLVQWAGENTSYFSAEIVNKMFILQQPWRIKTTKLTAQVWKIATQTFLLWWVVFVYFLLGFFGQSLPPCLGSFLSLQKKIQNISRSSSQPVLFSFSHISLDGRRGEGATKPMMTEKKEGTEHLSRLRYPTTVPFVFLHAK